MMNDVAPRLEAAPTNTLTTCGLTGVVQLSLGRGKRTDAFALEHGWYLAWASNPIPQRSVNAFAVLRCVDDVMISAVGSVFPSVALWTEV